MRKPDYLWHLYSEINEMRKQFNGQTIWNNAKELTEELWFTITDIVFDILFLGFSVFLIYPRVQSIVEYVIANPASDFGHELLKDMNANPILYSIFIFALGIVFLSKWAQVITAKDRDKAMDAKIDKTNMLLEAIAQKLGVDTEAIKNEGCKNGNRKPK